jgi:hypothetical protein
MMRNWMKLVLGFNILLENPLGAFNGDKYLRSQSPSFHLALALKYNKCADCELSMQVSEMCA